MSEWLITGAGGMLGRDIVAVLRQAGEHVTGLDRATLDVTDEAAVRAALVSHRPGFVVNCAAWTAVDDAEAREGDALLVNGRGTRHVAAACAAMGVRLFHISTDYVFSGEGHRPYAEDDRAKPGTAYGRTKLVGEREVLTMLPDAGYVVRTAWLYGAGGLSFVTAMVRQEAAWATVDVVCDQHGQPTWTADVARQILALAGAKAAAGIYHATSSGQTTRFGLAREVFHLLGADPGRIRPVPTSAYPTPARRPRYTVLAHRRQADAGIAPIGAWDSALRRAWPHLLADQPTGMGHAVAEDRKVPRRSSLLE